MGHDSATIKRVFLSTTSEWVNKTMHLRQGQVFEEAICQCCSLWYQLVPDLHLRNKARFAGGCEWHFVQVSIPRLLFEREREKEGMYWHLEAFLGYSARRKIGRCALTHIIMILHQGIFDQWPQSSTSAAMCHLSYISTLSGGNLISVWWQGYINLFWQIFHGN